MKCVQLSRFALLALLQACDVLSVGRNEAPAEIENPQATLSEEPAAEAEFSDNGAWPSEFVDTDDSPLTAQEIVGMWSTAPHCAQPTVFSLDGGYTDYTGRSGRWELNGDLLTMSGRGSGNEVNQLDANTFTASAPRTQIDPDAIRTFLIYRRC